MKIKNGIIWLGFLALMIFLCLNRVGNVEISHYTSAYFSDKAGYNVFLPATFIYDFQADQFPEKIDTITGTAFHLNYQTNKVETKYPVGVAILQAPFWLTAHAFADQPTGYSQIYLRSSCVAAAFYLVLGFFFIHLILKRKYPKLLTGPPLAILLCCTSLYYYTTREVGLSHVYSFTIIAILLYYWLHFIEKQKRKYLIGVGVCLGFVLILRPINLLFIPFVMMWSHPAAWKTTLQQFKNKSWVLHLVALGIPAALVLVPQLMYYHYLDGSVLSYSYKDEGFIYFMNPKVLAVLFAPHNGLFLYTPMTALMFFAPLIIKSKNPDWEAFKPLAFLLIYALVYGSWWSFYLGCGLGHRAMVDFLPLLLIWFVPLYIKLQNKWWFWLISLVLGGVFVKMSYIYIGCFNGEHTWDWAQYFAWLTKLP